MGQFQHKISKEAAKDRKACQKQSCFSYVHGLDLTKINIGLKSLRSWIGLGVIIALFFGFRYFYFQPIYQSGESAPGFKALLSDSTTFELEELRGNYVLLDFWGSWCSPCIKDKPVLKALYQKYHTASFRSGRGFEIVSIAVEETESRWRGALSRFSPEWRYQILDQVNSLRFFDGPLTKQFGVKQLPSAFLLDPNGQIIATNPTLTEVEKILKSELGE